jgi:hypothetical protein
MINNVTRRQRFYLSNIEESEFFCFYSLPYSVKHVNCCCEITLSYLSLCVSPAGELCQDILHALLRLRLLRRSHLQLLLVPQLAHISFAATYANTVSAQTLDILSLRCTVSFCFWFE